MGSKIPIENMGYDEFNRFKSKYLDRYLLSEESLAEIKKLFGLDKKDCYRLNCDEAHTHNYSCVSFDNPILGVVERLLQEIDSEDRTLGKIRNLILMRKRDPK